MRRIVSLAFSIALLPSLAAAQQTLPATLPTLPARLPAPTGSLAPAWVQAQPQIATMQSMQAMQRQFTEMHAMQLRARSAILAALTPAHRAFLAQLVGQLAVAPNPDATSAARQLDATLSPNEGRAVVAAEATMQTEMLAAMQNAVGASATTHVTTSAFATGDDAGQVLLRYAVMGMIPMPNVLFGPGQQPRR